MDSLTSRGRLTRYLATLLGLGLLLAGTVAGVDDDFPFAPFRMFSTTDPPNEPIEEALLEAVDVTGADLVLTESNSGVRRAEVEGQLARFTARPELLQQVAVAYHRRNPGRPRLRTVEIVMRSHELHGGRPTGRVTDETVVSWLVR